MGDIFIISLIALVFIFIMVIVVIVLIFPAHAIQKRGSGDLLANPICDPGCQNILMSYHNKTVTNSDG